MPRAPIDPWPDVAERHKIRVYSPRFGGVTGLLPEQFNQTYSNQFVAPFQDVLSRFNIGFVTAQEILAKEGVDYSLVFKELTNLQWHGASPLTTTIRFRYFARQDARKDVTRPVFRLIEMSAPGESEFTKEKVPSAVGETVEEWQKEAREKGQTLALTMLDPPDPVQVEFGHVLRLQKALVTSVSVDWSNISDDAGVPVMADVQFQVTTKRAFVMGDPEVEVMVDGWLPEEG